MHVLCQQLNDVTCISGSQEMNEKDELTRFLQIWMTPDRRGHKPQYGSSVYSKADRHNKLLQILGGSGAMPSWETASPGAGITLHQVDTCCVYVVHCQPDVRGGTILCDV